jgi:hypothetical protein
MTTLTERRCSCGYAADDADGLSDHLLEVFTSENDVGLDGEVHFEGDSRLACACGFIAIFIAELDAHFFRVFVAPGRVGLDGVRHAPISDGHSPSSFSRPGA